MISLGFFCSTALELQRYGLRDASYPFDWIISRIEPALALIDSDFADFLQPEGLSRNPDRPNIVHDKIAGVDLYHDFDPSLTIAEQYETVAAKYGRRIRRLKAVERRTLFVRYIDPAPGTECTEFEFLDWNMARVLEILRRSHPQNDLLLVGHSGLPATCGGLPIYTFPPDDGDVVAREFLRKNPALRRELTHLSYPLPLRLRNLLLYHARSSGARLLGPRFTDQLRKTLAARGRRRTFADRAG